MATLVLHHKGAYQLYTTIADVPVYESALTREQVIQVLSAGATRQEIDERLERTHRTGCSDARGVTLHDCIAHNRAGPGDTPVPEDEFIRKWLTLPSEETT